VYVVLWLVRLQVTGDRDTHTDTGSDDTILTLQSYVTCMLQLYGCIKESKDELIYHYTEIEN
jgi:hypothetical protein